MIKFEDVLKGSRRIIKTLKKSTLDVSNKNVKYRPLHENDFDTNSSNEPPDEQQSPDSSKKHEKTENGENFRCKTAENKNVQIFTFVTVSVIIYLCMFAGYRSRHAGVKNNGGGFDGGVGFGGELSATEALVRNEILADEIEQEILEDVEVQLGEDLDYSRFGHT